MELSITTPALLFPAISLLLLAYTNRYIAIASLVRKLIDDYKAGTFDRKKLVMQISNLRKRLNYIRYMQGFGVFSFLLCIMSMYSVYNEWNDMANLLFAVSLIALLISILFSMIEIFKSTTALEIMLSEIEGLDKE